MLPNGWHTVIPVLPLWRSMYVHGRLIEHIKWGLIEELILSACDRASVHLSCPLACCVVCCCACLSVSLCIVCRV